MRSQENLTFPTSRLIGNSDYVYNYELFFCQVFLSLFFFLILQKKKSINQSPSLCFEIKLKYKKISGPEVVGGTSGESEAKLRDIFAAATTFARQVCGVYVGV
jgi:hypothetical protein